MDHCAYSKRTAESYTILDVPVGASQEELKQAYRDLARIWHPDRFAQHQRLHQKAEKRFAEISTAYDFLTQVSEAEASLNTASSDMPGTAGKVPESAVDDAPSLRPQSAYGRAWVPDMSAVIRMLMAMAATIAVLVIGASIYQQATVPIRSLQSVVERSGISYVPNGPVLRSVPEIANRLTVDIGAASRTLLPSTEAAPRQEIPAVRLSKGRRMSAQVRPTTIITAEWTQGSIPGDVGMFTMANETAFECLICFAGRSNSLTVHVPAYASIRIGNIAVDAYTVELRLGFDWNGRKCERSAEPVQLGTFQFVRAQSSVSYSDRYDVVLRED